MLGGGIRIYPRFFAVARVNLRSMPFNGVRDLPVIKREFSACALNEANRLTNIYSLRDILICFGMPSGRGKYRPEWLVKERGQLEMITDWELSFSVRLFQRGHS